MKTTKRVTSIVCAYLFAADVIAADGVAGVESALDEPLHFTGWAIGAGLSLGRIGAEIHDGDGDVDDVGAGYAGLITWRHQRNNNWIFGVEGSLGDRQGDLGDDTVSFEFDYNWHWSALAGKAFGSGKKQLLYAKLGVGGIQVKGEVHGLEIPSHNFKGVRSAFGYERVLTEHVHLKTEVSYVSYDKNFDQLQTAVSFLYKF
jgi:opacity protein-like surface antigen